MAAKDIKYYLRRLEHKHADDLEEGELYSIIHSPDGSLAIATAASGTVHVLDGATGKALSSFTASEEGVNVCRFWGNDELLVGDAGGDISHWSLADTSKALRHYRGHDVQVKNVEVVNERYFLSCAFDGCLRLWDRFAQPPYWPEGVPGVSPAQVYNLPGRRLSANTLFYHLDLQRIALHRGGVDDWVARGRPFTPTAQLTPLHQPHADTTSGHAPRWP
ncbi:pkwA, partial [Symbiodinium sp. KB8]